MLFWICSWICRRRNLLMFFLMFVKIVHRNGANHMPWPPQILDLKTHLCVVSQKCIQYNINACVIVMVNIIINGWFYLNWTCTFLSEIAWTNPSAKIILLGLYCCIQLLGEVYPKSLVFGAPTTKEIFILFSPFRYYIKVNIYIIFKPSCQIQKWNEKFLYLTMRG